MSAHQPHDALFKRIFSNPAWLAALLRAILPPELERAVDWSSLGLVSAELVQDDLARLYGDLAARARWRDAPGVLLFEIQHKSSPAPLAALESLERAVLLGRTVMEHDPEVVTLPCVVCVLVAHTGRAWTAPRGLAELTGLPEGHPGRSHGPDLRVVLDDLSALPSAGLLGRELPDVPLLALFFLKHVRDSTELCVDLELVLPQLQRVTTSTETVAGVIALMYYLREMSNVPAEELQTFFREKVGPAAERAFVSSADLLRAEGRTAGMKEGRKEGLKEGLREGEARALLRVLERRGVVVSAPQRERVLACTEVEVLERWLDKAVVAVSADDVFG